MPDHLKVVILLAAWCQLRRGEILGLRRRDVDPLHATIRIEQTRTFTMKGESTLKAPKTAAGSRTVAIPQFMVAALDEHLTLFTAAAPDSLVVPGRGGRLLSRDALQGSWERARQSVGRSDLHLHDLRHTGLTLAAATGATTAELMLRAGHASPAAAHRYQHATLDRDRVLANALNELVNQSLEQNPTPPPRSAAPLRAV